MKTKRQSLDGSGIRRPPGWRARRGFQVMELLFAAPILMVLFVAAMAYGKVMMLRSGVTRAAVAGAREAAKGGDILDVAEAVNRVLAAYEAAVTAGRGSGTKVLLERGAGTVAAYGDPCLSLTPPAPAAGDEIRVTVCIAPGAKKTDGRRPVLPWSGILGPVFYGNRLSIGSLVKSES